MLARCPECKKEVEPRTRTKNLDRDKQGRPLFVPKKVEERVCPRCGALISFKVEPK